MIKAYVRLSFALCVACTVSAHAAPLFTERLSINPTSGESGNAPSIQSAISSDGCVVAFRSTATNLVDASFGVTSQSAPQVYAVNRCVTPYTLELISVDAGGTLPANGTNRFPNVSADGRYVAFQSFASNLPGGANFSSIFIRDRMTQTTLSPLATWQSTAQVYTDASKPYMSADGKHLALDFQASGVAHNLYLFDLTGATATMQAICPSAAMSASTPCQNAVISADATAVVFDSSYGFIAADTNGFDDDYVYSVADASYRLVSVTAAGTQADDNVEGNGDGVPSVDGSFVVFFNYLSHALGGNSLLLKNLASGALQTINVTSSGQVVGINAPNPSISDDGNRVGLTALSVYPLVDHPNPHQTDSLVFDAPSSRLVSVCQSSQAAYGDDICENVMVSGNGRWAVFDSYASNLDAAGANGFQQIFVTNTDAVIDLVFADSF